MERKGLGKKVTGALLLCTFLRRLASGVFGTPPWLPLNCLGIPIASLNNENGDVPDVKNRNRKFDVSLGGTFLSHTTNLNASLYEFFESKRWRRENINFRLLFLTFGTSRFSLLKVPNMAAMTLFLSSKNPLLLSVAKCKLFKMKMGWIARCVHVKRTYPRLEESSWVTYCCATRCVRIP